MPPTNDTTSPAAIELQEVTFGVEGRQILNGVDLTVEAGQIVSIMGASGCGKTTLLRTIIGLTEGARGRVLIEGENLVGMSEGEVNRVRQKMGLVFQYAALFDSLTVWENVAFGLLRQRRPRREIDETVDGLLEAVGLQPGVVREQLPHDLSGGMRKRVGMARALALNPKIVLYDEPTSGLDPIMATTIDELILSLRDRFQTTAVVVSHHVPSILRISDRVAMLHGGRIIAAGTPAEISETNDPIVRQFIEGRTEGPLGGGDTTVQEVL